MDIYETLSAFDSDGISLIHNGGDDNIRSIDNLVAFLHSHGQGDFLGDDAIGTLREELRYLPTYMAAKEARDEVGLSIYTDKCQTLIHALNKASRSRHRTSISIDLFTNEGISIDKAMNWIHYNGWANRPIMNIPRHRARSTSIPNGRGEGIVDSVLNELRKSNPEATVAEAMEIVEKIVEIIKGDESKGLSE